MDRFIRQITREAGSIALKRFSKRKRISHKSDSPWSVVTDADVAVEKFLISKIKAKYPEHGIIAEESGRKKEDAEYVWIIDPIDGTLNFSTGVPLFGTMVALARNKEIILSAIYLPVLDELFFAEAGKGAYLDDKRIRTSTTRKFAHSLGCGFSSIRMRTAPFIKHVFKAIGQEHVVFNSFGAISINACFVACGRRDWIMAPHGGQHDFAATSLLLQESGCDVADINGKPWKFGAQGIVAANPVLHKQLLKVTVNG